MGDALLTAMFVADIRSCGMGTVWSCVSRTNPSLSIPSQKKTRPYRGEAEIGRGEGRPSASQASRSAIGCAQGRAEGRPSASQARNRAPIFRERLLEEALRDETAKCFINIKKERCTERVIDDRTTTIREAICIGSQYSSSTAHSCVNK